MGFLIILESIYKPKTNLKMKHFSRDQFKVRKNGTTVSPSGVRFGILSLIGKFQSDITIQDEKKRRNAIDNMLLECLTNIGSKTDLTLQDVKNLFAVDRKHLLLEIRKFSNEDDPNFTFDYEFPVKDGRKRKQRFNVDFNTAQFPVRPFFWLDEKIRESYAKRNDKKVSDISDEEMENYYRTIEEFPTFKVDGDDVEYDYLLENFKEQSFTFPECGVEIKYNLLTASRENEFSRRMNASLVSSHSQIQMRKPVYLDKEKSEKQKSEVFDDVPLNILSNVDIESLRKDFMKKEGVADTTVVVSYKDDPNTQAQVDLVGTPAFFFPSMAV